VAIADQGGPRFIMQKKTGRSQLHDLCRAALQRARRATALRPEDRWPSARQQKNHIFSHCCTASGFGVRSCLVFPIRPPTARLARQIHCVIDGSFEAEALGLTSSQTLGGRERNHRHTVRCAGVSPRTKALKGLRRRDQNPTPETTSASPTASTLRSSTGLQQQ
jgi:hypothetical protein